MLKKKTQNLFCSANGCERIAERINLSPRLSRTKVFLTVLWCFFFCLLLLLLRRMSRVDGEESGIEECFWQKGFCIVKYFSMCISTLRWKGRKKLLEYGGGAGKKSRDFRSSWVELRRHKLTRSTFIFHPCGMACRSSSSKLLCHAKVVGKKLLRVEFLIHFGRRGAKIWN